MLLEMKACRSRTRDGSGDDPSADPPGADDVMVPRRVLMEKATREINLFVSAVR